jgi:hypothetical protein
MMRRLRWFAALIFPLVWQASAQQYSGPRPPKPDIPYLKHASNLIATEVTEAKEEKAGSGTTVIMQGAASTAKTPLALPIFLITADQLSPARLQLFRADSKEGHREVVIGPKRDANAIRMELTKLSSDNVYKIEVGQEIEPGEYCLCREGSSTVFCFQVY